MKIIVDVLVFLEESKFKLKVIARLSIFQEKNTEEVIMYLPFIPIITSLQAAIEPVV